jgi:hypothetical protein
MQSCSIENCENKYKAKGFCQKHYRKNKKYGNPLAKKEKQSCSIENCENKYAGKGFCQKHYDNNKKYGNPLAKKEKQFCSIENCENKYYGKGFCQKHYQKYKKYGDPLAGKNSQNKAGTKEYIYKNSEIDINNCWIWKRYKDKDGYGRPGFKGKPILAHRLSYLTFVGEIPNNLFVLHNCDNPSCVNPKHLFLGDHQDNMNDKVNKNRQSRLKGEDAGNSKLVQEEVDEIRTLYFAELAERAKGKGIQLTQRELAKRFGVGGMAISNIVNNKVWKF